MNRHAFRALASVGGLCLVAVTLAACSKSPEPYVAKGDAQAKISSWYRALAYYDSALAIDPNCVPALIGKGNGLAMVGAPTTALTFFEKAQKLDPKNLRALIGKARMLVVIESPVEGQRAFEQAARRVKHPDSLLVVEAWALYRARRLKDADDAVNEAIAQNDKNVEAWLAKAVMHMKNTILFGTPPPPEVLPSVERAEAIEPRNGRIIALKSFVLSRLGRFKEAAAACDTALQINKTNPQPRYDYGSALMIPSDRSVIWRRKSLALYNAHLNGEAAVAVDSCLAMTPNDPDVWKLKGDIYTALHQPKEAAQFYAKQNALEEAAHR